MTQFAQLQPRSEMEVSTQANGTKWRIDTRLAVETLSRVKIGKYWVVASCSIDVDPAEQKAVELGNTSYHHKLTDRDRHTKAEIEQANLDLFSPVIKVQPVRVAPFELADLLA